MEITKDQTITSEKRSKAPSPSQRLRAVMFHLWKKANEELPFEFWYCLKMENIIEHFKSKLD